MSSRVGSLYLVAAGLAFLALAFGAWDVWIRGGTGVNPMRQVLLPAAMLVLMIVLHRRSKTEAPPPP